MPFGVLKRFKATLLKIPLGTFVTKYGMPFGVLKPTFTAIVVVAPDEATKYGMPFGVLSLLEQFSPG